MLRRLRLAAGAVALLGAVELAVAPSNAHARGSDQCNVAVTYNACWLAGEESIHEFCRMVCSSYSEAFMCAIYSPQVVCYGEPI